MERFQLPSMFVRIYALFDKTVKGTVAELGKELRFSNQKIKDELGIQFRNAEEAIIAMAESLIQFGVI